MLIMFSSIPIDGGKDSKACWDYVRLLFYCVKQYDDGNSANY